MSKQFLYARLNFSHKTKRGTTVTAHQSDVVVEVPKDLIHCEHPESSTGNNEEKVIALEIARVIALGTFPAFRSGWAAMKFESLQGRSYHLFRTRRTSGGIDLVKLNALAAGAIGHFLV
jgi:hypothetical protein